MGSEIERGISEMDSLIDFISDDQRYVDPEFCMEFGGGDLVQLQEILNNLIHIEYEVLECVETIAEVYGDKENTDKNQNVENINFGDLKKLNGKQLHEKLKINAHIDRVCYISHFFDALNSRGELKEILENVQANYNRILDRYETAIVQFNKILCK